MVADFRIIGTDLPGRSCGPAPGPMGEYRNIHVGIQCRMEPVDLVPGDAASAVWEFDAEVRGGQFAGPYVHGRPPRKFLYLSWGEVNDGGFLMFRRAKLLLDPIDAAAADGHAIEGTLGLTDAKGHPLCASVTPPRITWTVVA